MKWLSSLRKNKTTCGKVLDLWLEKQEQECSKYHYGACAGVRKNYLADLDDIPWYDLTPALVREFRKNWGTPHSANRTLVLLKAAMNWAQSEELIEYNPIAKVRRLPQEKNVKYVPPRSDVEKVKAACKKNRLALLMAYIHTGGRKQEILQLKKKDVHLDGPKPHLTLWTRKKRDRSKTPRTVPVTPELKEILAPLVSANGTAYVFAKKNGKPLKNMSRWLPTLCERAGVQPFQFHSIRHRFAHDMHERKAPIDDIQQVLGHEDQKTTRIYLSQIVTRHDAVRYMYDQDEAGNDR